MSNEEGCLAWQRLKKSISETEPKDLVKFVVIGVCLILVYVQVSACFYKLENPEITSHTALKMNETMSYPALTLCREPPFNRRVFEKFNISTAHFASYPVATQWITFKFDEHSINEFFNESVYDDTTFSTYALGSIQANVVKSSSLHLTYGLCHSFRPKNYTTVDVGKKMGYAIKVTHDLYDYRPFYDEDPGWHIYIHEPREVFSENSLLLGGRQDNIFLRVGEKLEITLDATEYRTVQNCNHSQTYSETQCEEDCWVKWLMENRTCSGPWFPQSNLPPCDTFEKFFTLHRSTMGEMKNLDCCVPHCTTKQYRASVVGRSPSPSSEKLQSTVLVFFSSKSVLSMTETYAYDWNVFLADLGGSLGFLLGLSVLSLVAVLEQIVKFLFQKPQKNEPTQNHDSYTAYYKWKFETLRINFPIKNTEKF